MNDVLLFQAIILGLIEGLTEFIPVSSTGHLILVADLLGFTGNPSKVFEVVIQLGAIGAICWLYRAKLLNVAFTLHKDVASRHFAWIILLGFLPAALIGAMFHDIIKSVLFSPKVVAISLVIGGFIILLVEYIKPTAHLRNINSVSAGRALAIGLIQCLAMIPGVSRSGATIMGAMLLGLERKVAAEFSFFLAIPTMLGAASYDLYKNYDLLSQHNLLMISVGFLTAFFAAMCVVRLLLTFISKHGFVPFAYYRIIIGSIMLYVLFIA